QIMGAAVGPAGIKVPVSTIECIAGSARAQDRLKRFAVEALPQRRTQGVDIRHNTVRGFAVACVGEGFTAAAVNAIVEFGHHHDGFGLAAAADRKGAGNRPALDSYGELHARSSMTVLFWLAQGLSVQGLSAQGLSVQGLHAAAARSPGKIRRAPPRLPPRPRAITSRSSGGSA